MDPFKRHIDEDLVISITARDRTGARQSVAGVSDLRVKILRQSDMVEVVSNDHTNCRIDETGVATAGDVSYHRPVDAPPGSVLPRGRYLMVFLCTINSEPVEFPEDDYIPLIIT